MKGSSTLQNIDGDESGIDIFRARAFFAEQLALGKSYFYTGLKGFLSLEHSANSYKIPSIQNDCKRRKMHRKIKIPFLNRLTFPLFCKILHFSRLDCRPVKTRKLDINI
ncbi:hypothetical protein BTA30_09645 [Bacillus swezeyi]|uniref:Uncharacterized protein n=1 Tax=Bacillus swezeyi TaxID=1925020 RepID=A0A1R1RYI7_9BACI|nr:hypothetical protein BW143_14400 [Bacillus swezeyi]OMI31076.1 hypothetical protein BTA30_09645 [Bacillus swezeyi]